MRLTSLVNRQNYTLDASQTYVRYYRGAAVSPRNVDKVRSLFFLLRFRGSSGSPHVGLVNPSDRNLIGDLQKGLQGVLMAPSHKTGSNIAYRLRNTKQIGRPC